MGDRPVLEKLAALELRTLADRARAVREVRDRMVSGLDYDAFAEDSPARGEHNPGADLGLDVVPEDDPARTALEEALSALPPAALREVWAAVLVGRGEYQLSDWDRAMADAKRLTDVSTGMFMGVADLQGCLMRVVYELERA